MFLSDEKSLTQGLIDASAMYCPLLIPTSYRDDVDKEESDRNLKRVRAARSGFNTMIDNKGYAFWKSIPTDFKSKLGKYDNFDVEAITLLLQQPPVDIKPINLVVWILGVCPSEEVLTKAKKLFIQQSKARGRSVLLVVLASETKAYLDERTDETLLEIADPFQPLIAIYREAVADSALLPDYEDVSTVVYDERNIHELGDRLPRAPRLIMQHAVTWSEILAQAYILEDKMDKINLIFDEKEKKSKRGSSKAPSVSGKGSVIEDVKKGFFGLPIAKKVTKQQSSSVTVPLSDKGLKKSNLTKKTETDQDKTEYPKHNAVCS